MTFGKRLHFVTMALDFTKHSVSNKMSKINFSVWSWLFYSSFCAVLPTITGRLIVNVNSKRDINNQSPADSCHASHLLAGIDELCDSV